MRRLNTIDVQLPTHLFAPIARPEELEVRDGRQGLKQSSHVLRSICRCSLRRAFTRFSYIISRSVGHAERLAFATKLFPVWLPRIFRHRLFDPFGRCALKITKKSAIRYRGRLHGSWLRICNGHLLTRGSVRHHADFDGVN
jgi:hypothetical protein